MSIIVQTKHNPTQVQLIPDVERISHMDKDTINSFRDQQKYKVEINFNSLFVYEVFKNCFNGNFLALQYYSYDEDSVVQSVHVECKQWSTNTRRIIK